VTDGLQVAGHPDDAQEDRVEVLTADGQDLAFVHVELADDRGTVEMLAADTVTVAVTGPGELAALGSAAPETEETFTGDTHTTHYGRALAIVRAGDRPGTITVTATSREHGSATVELRAVPSPASGLGPGGPEEADQAGAGRAHGHREV